MSWLLLLKNECKLQIYDMRQYWFESVGGLLMICGLFVALFYGAKSFAFDGEQAQSLDGLLIGFLLWGFASAAYLSVTKTVIDDTQKGYIEQLFITPKGITAILLVKTLVDLLYGLLFITIMAYLTMWLTGNWIDINLPMFYLALLLAAPSLVGLGLIISGFALVFKRVDTLGQLMALALMALVAVDGLPFGPLSFIPFTPGASLARAWVSGENPIQLMDVAIVLANSGIYLLLGMLVFKHFEKVAKRKNLIGQY
ncbi:ABC transporter permease [Aliiglaciecola litoralis]|uniref:ABC-2 type transporter transmembrane domain-containing protein n=1 Tax=Aliiglaciecola litoralis TaxID=582857 RepID=A0ABP3WR37_9ALTE